MKDWKKFKKLVYSTQTKKIIEEVIEEAKERQKQEILVGKLEGTTKKYDFAKLAHLLVSGKSIEE